MDLKNLIKKYTNEIGFIFNINDLYKELKEYYSTTEIIKILKEISINNFKLYQTISKEINKINNLPPVYYVNNTSAIDIPSNLNIEEQSEKNLSVECPNLHLYIDAILNEEVTDIIPIISQIEQEEQINIVKCKILETIVLYKKELLINQNEEDIIYFKEQINILQKKLNQVIKYQEKIKRINKDSNQKNHLVFLNNNGKTLFYDDLSQIDEKDYGAILDLLNLIINNENNSFKTFINNEKFKGLLEVRDLSAKCRVVFKNIYANYYAIIYTFYKDCDNSSIYRSRLLNKVNRFNDLVEKIKNQLIIDPKEFETSEQEVINYLSSFKKKKGI